MGTSEMEESKLTSTTAAAAGAGDAVSLPSSVASVACAAATAVGCAGAATALAVAEAGPGAACFATATAPATGAGAGAARPNSNTIGDDGGCIDQAPSADVMSVRLLSGTEGDVVPTAAVGDVTAAGTKGGAVTDNACSLLAVAAVAVGCLG